MLESAGHAGSCFVTLTYEDKNLPEGLSLEKSHPQKWLKRLRKALPETKIRYFLVGEYGDETQRPHYHAAVFGLDPDIGGGIDGRAGIVQKTWGLGHTFTGTLTTESASYIAGYVTKKLTNKNDPYVQKKLSGRYPEFARMSLNPGIGANVIGDIADAYDNPAASNSIISQGDVTSSLRHGKRILPLGRYLKSKLREALGYGEILKADAFKLAQIKMQAVQIADAEIAKTIGKNLVDYVVDKRNQQMLNLEAKYKLKKGRKSL